MDRLEATTDGALRQSAESASIKLFEEAGSLTSDTASTSKEKRNLALPDGSKAEIAEDKDSKQITCKVALKNGDKLEIQLQLTPDTPTFKLKLERRDGTKVEAEGDASGYEMKFRQSKGGRIDFEGLYRRERGWEKGPGGNRPVPPHFGESFDLILPGWSKTTVQCYSGDSWTSSFVRGTEDRFDGWSWGKPGPNYRGFKDRVSLLRDTMDFTRKPAEDQLNGLLERWTRFNFATVIPKQK